MAMKKYLVFVIVLLLLLFSCFVTCKDELSEDRKIALRWIINDVSSMMKTEQEFNSLLDSDLEILENNKQVLNKNIEIKNNFDNYKEHPEWNKGLEIPRFLKIGSNNMETLCEIIDTEELDGVILKQLNEIEITADKTKVLNNTKKTLAELEKIFCVDKSYAEIVNYNEYEQELRENEESIDEYIEMQRQAQINKIISQLKDDQFTNGFTVIEFEDKYGIVSEEREIVAEPVYNEIGDEVFSNGFARVKTEEGKWGFINKNGEMVIEAVYDKASSFNVNGFAEVVKDGDTFLINKNGERKRDENYWDLLKRNFVINESSIKLEMRSENGEYTSEDIKFKENEHYNLIRKIVVLPKNDNSVMWELPFQYINSNRMTLAFFFFYNGSIKIQIKRNSKVLAEEVWDTETDSPIISKKNNEVIEKIAFIRDWSPEIKTDENIDIKSITIENKSYIIIEEKERNIKEINVSDDEDKEEEKEKFINFKFPELKLNKNYFTEAHVLKIIDFNMKLDTSLIEVIFNGKRIFVKLIGIRTPFNQKTVKYLQDNILHKNVFLEKESGHAVYEDNDYLINRYVWLKMPQENIYKGDVFDNLVNVKLIRQGYAKPVLYKGYPIRYETYYLDAYQRGRQKLLEEIKKERERKEKEKEENKESSQNIFSRNFSNLFNLNVDENDSENDDFESDEKKSIRDDDTDDDYDKFSSSNTTRAIDKKSNSFIDTSSYDILENTSSTTYSTCDIDCPVSRRTGARCQDGSESASIGRGTCSGHGGVECWYCN